MASNTVRIAIVANAARARAELNSVGETATRQVRGLSRLSGALKSGLAVGGAALVGSAVKDAVFSGIEYGKVLKQTDVALKANAGTSGQTVKALKERAATIETATGALLDENDVLAGQQNLLRAGIKGETAFSRAAQTTADIAAARGITFQAASTVVQKALLRPEKATAALAKQGVLLSKAQQDQIKSMVAAGDTAGAQGIVLDALSTKYKGAAQAAGSDATAGFRRLQDTLEDTGRDIATRVLPVVSKLATFLSQNSAQVVIVAEALAALGAVILTVNAATKVVSAATTAYSAAARIATGVQAAFNLVMSLNPIGLVVIAIIALVAAFVLAYKKSDAFRAIVQKVFGALKSGVLATIGFVRKNWPTILAVLTGPIGLAVLAFVKHKDKIVGLFRSIKDTVSGIFSGFGDLLVSGIKSAVNSVISLVNVPIRAVNKIADKLPGVPSLPTIPALASGGIVRRPTLALVGEAGPEAVVPLDGRFGCDSTTINVYVTAGVGDPADIGRVAVSAIRAHERRTGRRVLTGAA